MKPWNKIRTEITIFCCFLCWGLFAWPPDSWSWHTRCGKGFGSWWPYVFLWGNRKPTKKIHRFQIGNATNPSKMVRNFPSGPVWDMYFVFFFWWYIINGVAGVASTSYRSLTFPHVKPHPHFSGFHPFRRNRRSFTDSTRARRLQVVPGSGEVVAIRAKNDFSREPLQIYYTPEFTNMTSLKLSTMMMYFLFKKRWFSMAMLVFGG